MCSSVYFNFYILGYQTKRQKILHQMITSIFWVQSALNFLMNVILIFQGYSQIFEVFNTFKRYITCLCCILLTRNEHTPSFFRIYISTSLLPSD